MGKPKMPRGPKKHLKRLAAPSAWMLDKLGGKYAPHPSAGPHKLRECLPLCIFIRNRLKYALSGREVSLIVKQRLVKVDNKVRTDETYPAGFMDVISIEKSNEHFRLMYDTKGRFAIHRISAEEAEYKLCKVKKVQLGDRGIPYIVTHDGRTIRYPDPAIKVNDSVKLDLNENKIVDFLKFEVGQTVMAASSRPASPTSSSSAPAASLGSHCPRARASSSRSPKSATNAAARRRRPHKSASS